MGEQVICECGHSKTVHQYGAGMCFEPQVDCKCPQFAFDRALTFIKTNDELVSSNGGKRQRLNLRFDKLPGGFTSLVWIARVNEYGALKYELDNWKKLDPHSEQSPLNHGVGPALEACELEYGSLERIWALAKAAWNLLAQIWFEMEHRKKQLEGSTIEDCVEEWFEKKCAPTTYKR